MKKSDLLHLIDCPGSIGSQLANAAIVAGFNFFGVLVGLGATGLLGDPQTGLIAAGISAGFSFFASLIAQRGLQSGTSSGTKT